MANETVQVFKMVLILFKAFRKFVCSDPNLKLIIYCQFTPLEIMTSYSQQKFVKEGEISYNPLKRFKEPLETETFEIMNR